MKKSIVFVCVSLLSISLIGCGKEDVKVKVDRGGSVITEVSTKQESSTAESKEINETALDVSNSTEVSSMATQETSKSNGIVEENTLSISFVKDIITNLMSSTSQSDIDTFLDSIEVDSNFIFIPIVNQSTTVSIESIGINELNSSEYLGIVTLRQSNGISKFAVTVTFNSTKLSSFTYSKF